MILVLFSGLLMGSNRFSPRKKSAPHSACLQLHIIMTNFRLHFSSAWVKCFGNGLKKNSNDGRNLPRGNATKCRWSRAYLAAAGLSLCLLTGAALAGDNQWSSTDWPEYKNFIDSLRDLSDAELTSLNGSVEVVYGFLLAAGETLDAIAMSQTFAERSTALRRHAHRCAYRYLSDRLTYQYAPDTGPPDWPFGGLVVIAQEAFDECLVRNIENKTSTNSLDTIYLPYIPEASQ